jgi:hypothetical protein
MKIIKTELRNKMVNDWLNHRIQSDDILYHFQELKSRMKKLPPQSSSGIFLCSLIHFCIH